MALWNSTEMSKILGCSPQNINQQKPKLKELGYIEVDPADNKEKINENGYNYLLNKRKLTMQMNNNNLNNACLKDGENIENSNNTAFKQDFIIDLLQNENADLKKQLEEEKNQTKHWQELYIQQIEDYKKITFPLMIGTEEQNKQQQEHLKKGFFGRIFNIQK